MSVSVCCPRCQVACHVPPELLGRTGRCNKCAQRIRLATPTAVLLDEPAPAGASQPDELPPLGELQPIGELPSIEPAAALAEEDWPDSPVVLDDPAPRPQARRKRPESARRGPSKVVLAFLAVVGLVGGGAGGALLVRHFTAPEPVKPDTRAAAEPPAPVEPPTPAPAPAPVLPNPDPIPPQVQPQPLPPDPKPNPQPLPPDPKPPVPPPAPKNVLKLPGPVASLTAGAAGRYVVFQIAQTGTIFLFDTKTGASVWTLNGAKTEDMIAVSRTKLFIGKVAEARLDVFDLNTAAREGSISLQGAAAGSTLKHLAVGSASDGPILVVTQNVQNTFRVRLIDGVAFTEVSVPLEDPGLAVVRAFPFTATTMAQRVAVGADGRAMTLGNRFVVRTDDKYRGGLLNGAGIAMPAPDGLSFVGSGLFGADGVRIATPALPAGTVRRYLPAAGGPFIVSAEYKPADPSVVKLSLHLGADPVPLGPLPGGEAVATWAKTDRDWANQFHHRLIFSPEPGRVIFAPPGFDTVHVIPVDIAAMLRAAGRDPLFTSVAPAETREGRPYTYRATVAGGRGALKFTLEAGPPEMRINPDGLLSWPAPDAVQPGYDVRISARDADGRRAVQTFRLVVGKNAEAVAVVPKKDPGEIDPPKKGPAVIDLPKDHPNGARTVRLPAPAAEAVSGGNGRFVLLNLQALRQVAVFDAKEGKVVKYLATANANVVIAAGRDHLFVVDSEAKTLQRWSLTTFEKEATDKLPEGGPFSHAHMGSNSTGPLMLCPKAGPLEPTKPLLVDAVTLREIPLAGLADIPPNVAGMLKALPRSVRVSPDGQTFTWSPDRAARGAIVATVTDGKAQWKGYPTVANPLTPAAGGRFFYAYEGVYDDQLRRVYPAGDQPRVGVFAPAAQGNLFLQAEPAPPIPNGMIAPERAQVFIEGQVKPFAMLDGLDKPVAASPRFLHLAPRYGVLVMLTALGTDLVLHPFDLDAALAKSAADYLVVLSDAPARPVAGARFEYVPIVKSKKGGVKVKLDTGPDGMKATDDGRLTWDVPADAAGKEVAVKLTVSDASGQAVPQTFRLTVVAKGAPAPELPVAPAPRER